MSTDGVMRSGRPVSVEPGASSYWNDPQPGLDPRLFSAVGRIKPWVRNSIVGMVTEHFGHEFGGPERWATVWLAGSAVSRQWTASPAGGSPTDLDCLIGVDFPQFRETNPRYRGLSDDEIASVLNDGLFHELGERTRNWNGFELTFYVNPGAHDIRAINPYAAYNLTSDEWTVAPQDLPRASVPRSWDVQAQRDHSEATQIAKVYSATLSEVQNAQNPAHRTNAEVRLRHLLSTAASLFDGIHHSRRADFSVVGQGYWGPGNYRWQAGKRSGAVQSLRALKDYYTRLLEEGELSTYGLTLPSTDSLIVRAALYQE